MIILVTKSIKKMNIGNLLHDPSKYDINSEILDESITPDNSDNEEEDKNK